MRNQKEKGRSEGVAERKKKGAVSSEQEGGKREEG